MRNGPCCICGKWISKQDDPSMYGSVKQGSIRRYFHLSCFMTIGRGYNNGKAEEKKVCL